MADRQQVSKKNRGGFPVILVIFVIAAAAILGYMFFGKQAAPPVTKQAETPKQQQTVAKTIPAPEQAKPAPVPGPVLGPSPMELPPKIALPAFSFQSVGLGGGGGIYTPAISPADPNRFFVSCDMGGAYYSWDKAQSWRMVDCMQIKSTLSCKPAWHPTDAVTAYAYGGTEYKNVVMVTHDGGVTWKPVCDNQPWGGDSDVVRIYLDRKNPSTMLVGSKSKGVFISAYTGATWRSCPEITGEPSGFHIDVTTPADKRRIFAASSEGVWRSDDGGATWAKKVAGLPLAEVRDLAGGENPDGGKCVLFVAIPSKDVNGKYDGGVYRSADLGESWQSAMGEGIHNRLGRVDEYGAGDIPEYIHIAMPQNQTDIVYVSNKGTGYYPPNHNTLYKTTDSGKTWQFCFNGDPRFKEKNIELQWYSIEHCWDPSATGVSVNDNDPSEVLRTDGDKIFLSVDGAKSWREAYSKKVEGSEIPRKIPGAPWQLGKFAWQSIGVEVMSCWDYVIDPTDPKRHYICYTDSGFARSLDGGKTWYYSVEGSPWQNTWYGIVCDPKRPGVIYAACSNTHDVPHSTYTADNMSKLPGGVCISTDYGETWSPIADGLPQKPVTSIVMDPNSPPEARTFWVTVIDAGVYKSSDGGKSWVKKSNGLGTEKINRPYLIKRLDNGNLYCTVTCFRKDRDFPTDGPGLYKSTDGGENWTYISKSIQVGWPVGFDVDPADEKTIYLAASSGWACRSGGLYKTTDGGDTWKQLFNNETPGFGHRSLGGMFVRTKPGDPKTIYFSTSSHGLWISHDAGETFKHVKGLPFASVQRVTFDPADPKMMYVTTFGGGVWHGPAEGDE